MSLYEQLGKLWIQLELFSWNDPSFTYLQVSMGIGHNIFIPVRLTGADFQLFYFLKFQPEFIEWALITLNF